MAVSQLGIAIPSFWFAILLILLFAVKLQLGPAGGFPGWSVDDGGGLGPALRALLLPAVALAVVQAAILARIVRSAVLEVLREDFVRTARAKGQSPRGVLWGHVLRNAMIPVLTVMGLQFANLLAGTVVVEQVFVAARASAGWCSRRSPTATCWWCATSSCCWRRWWSSSTSSSTCCTW